MNLIDWYIEREKKCLDGKPYLTDHYINIMKSDPDYIKKSLMDNLDHDITLAIRSCELTEDIDINSGNKDEFVNEIFDAIKKEFIKD